MARRLTETQKKQIKNDFINGKTIDELSENFAFTKLTIIRNLKKNLDEITYDFLIKKNKPTKNNQSTSSKRNVKQNNNQLKDAQSNNSCNDSDNNFKENKKDAEFFVDQHFMEIAPLDFDINNETRSDLSSVSISEIDLPKVVYMIVDNRIELETKLLQDYPEWEFLSGKELTRKTIEIYFDLKTAKRLCTKEQKVIKIPNSDVFKLTAPFLLSQGISRIVSPENLISI